MFGLNVVSVVSVCAEALDAEAAATARMHTIETTDLDMLGLRCSMAGSLMPACTQELSTLAPRVYTFPLRMCKPFLNPGTDAAFGHEFVVCAGSDAPFEGTFVVNSRPNAPFGRGFVPNEGTNAPFEGTFALNEGTNGAFGRGFVPNEGTNGAFGRGFTTSAAVYWT